MSLRAQELAPERGNPQDRLPEISGGESRPSLTLIAGTSIDRPTINGRAHSLSPLG